jgi:hypothetical protein
MLKRFFLLMSLVLIVTAMAGCSSPLQTALGSEFTLSVGQSAHFAYEAMYIKFVNVTEDSRCPKGVQCIQAGRVSCDVEITKVSTKRVVTKDRILLTQTGLTDSSGAYAYQSYTIIFDVLPYPEKGKQIAKGDYRLTMAMTMLGK